MDHKPSWRKTAGLFLILAIITIWSVIVASFSGPIGTLPGFVQLIIYAFCGIIWIAPLKPLLQWMETGSWRRPG